MSRQPLRTLWMLLCLVFFGTQAPAQQPTRILFIGNSFTAANNLPEMFAKLVKAGQPALALETQAVTVGGSTLKGHLQRGDAQKAIRAGRWDYVILQDESSLGSVLLINGVRRPADPTNFWEGARAMDKEIKAVGAKTAFYHTWAWRGAPEGQAMLDYAYLTIAKELGAIDVPVGPAWQEAMRAAPSLGVNLYAADGAHPSAAGTYLAACELYAALFKKSPVGLPAKLVRTPQETMNAATPALPATIIDLSAEKAAGLQKAAWQTHERLQSGVYANLKRPDAPELPVMPAIGAITAAQLEGDYLGSLLLYDAPARMELSLARATDGGWNGRLKLTFAGNQQDLDINLAAVEVGEEGIRFEDANQTLPRQYDERILIPVTVTFRGGLVGRALRGVAEIRTRDNTLLAAGSWSANRKP